MSTDLQPTTRFSSRVADYAKYRPGYPRQVIDQLRQRIGLTRDWIIADMGCGTGISSRMFLENGNAVVGVEPNDDMRRVAAEDLAGLGRFNAVNAAAEATTLDDASVDLVVAAQAYHWFDHAAAAREWQRILRPSPGGFVVVMWNTRSANADLFACEYESLLQRYAPGYAEVAHRSGVTSESFRAPFGVAFERLALPNHQDLDWDALAGRVRSSSYVPLPGQAGHDELFAALRHAFDQHERGGEVRFAYETEVFFARIG